MKKTPLFLTIACLFCCFIQIAAQSSKYPKAYFGNPLTLPISLSGNFGELRNNHYHMGLDFRTQGREGLPVLAAAEGYVTRIKVEPGGFGNALYIKHPNGFTTLYAHLSRFNPELSAWVKQKQYQSESWKIDLQPDPLFFPVKKGALIGYSGNTGGSQAPHLHFEIRDSNDQTYNPLYFGFPLPDHQAPKITRVAIYDRNLSTYAQSPLLLPLKDLSTTARKIGSSSISVAISAIDLHDGSSNPNGIASAELWMDDSLQVSFSFEKLGYESTRYLNAHVDYKFKQERGGWLQHLSELPGYSRNSIYWHNGKAGVLDLSDRQVHQIRIRIYDTEHNSTEFQTRLLWDGTPSKQPYTLEQAQPKQLTAFEFPGLEYYIGEHSIYDAMPVEHSSGYCGWEGAVSMQHAIGNPMLPLHDSILIRISPNRTLTEFEKSRCLLRSQSGSRHSVQKVSWQKGFASGKSRDFGSFALVVDTIPPTIVPLGFSDNLNISKLSKLVFLARDNQGKIAGVRTEMDGKWIRFSNDKNLSFVYDMDEHCGPGPHELKIIVTDEAGNVKTERFRLLR